MDLLQEKLEPGYKVFVVPELATITVMGGYDIRPPKDPEQHALFSVASI